MRRWPLASALVLFGLLAQTACGQPDRGAQQDAHQGAQKIAHGRFDDVRLYPARGAPTGFALLLGEDDQADSARAKRMSAAGVTVAGVNLAALAQQAAHDGEDCLYAAGDLDNLSRYLQAYLQMPGYFPPVLVGADEEGVLAYALLAQADPGQFGGAVSLGFCPQERFPIPLCVGRALRYASPDEKFLPRRLAPAAQLPGPWRWIDEADSPQCEAPPAFVDARQGRRLAVVHADTEDALLRQVRALAASAEGMHGALGALSDLPLIELPPAHVPADTLVVLLSGDGGWADLDREVGKALHARGVGVVGWDSLRYFWKARTPQGLANDVARVVEHYRQRWQPRQILLVGYSQGADVLPFALNRMSAAQRAQIAATVWMGLGQRAAFEFHLTAWAGHSSGLPIAPEVAALKGLPALCLYGTNEHDSACRQQHNPAIRSLALPGGHHFGGDYAQLAQWILAAARQTQ